jgi:hypothetical protein
MCIKNALTALLIFLPFLCFSQIKISNVGDGWKNEVDSAIRLIKRVDTANYRILIENCTEIEFIISNTSSTKLPHTIAINTGDLKLKSINNIACVLVHESYHLYIFNHRIFLTPNEEELVCYTREYYFLCKLAGIEDWLFTHVINQMTKLRQNM